MEIETERLLLRRWRADDVEALAPMYADPEVMRYVGDGRVRTREETGAAIAAYERAWDTLGFGLFAVELRNGGTDAGDAAGGTGSSGGSADVSGDASGGSDRSGRPAGVLAGWVGLAEPVFLPEVMPSVEIGWRLGRPFWGRGIATEAAREVLRFAFSYARLPRVVSVCHVDNAPSLRVMRRLGMAEDRETVVPSRGTRVKVYALSRGRYLAGT
ncbi:GNAT family N-acetyltransferase [Yinghuangia sp. YIM S09857]|uniref:GNAT family N-acetyltransferase n=1 Tax=Yinghuangia sp. YIM S09857 TaxID=3436929 RepID=UPI003F532F13